MRFLTATLFTALLSAPAFAADLGTYRPGTSYNSTVAQGADVCDSQCAGDAQCRAWNYVKPNPKAKGVCEFLSTASAPISSQISISGESASVAPFSSRVRTGGTNTVRVGTPITTRSNTVKVGQTPSGRRVVRETPTRRVKPQQTHTRPVQDMSLTAQQNRYRQGHINGQTQTTPRAVAPRTSAPQKRQPAFRPILDGAAPQQAYAPQRPVRQPVRAQNSRVAPVQRQANPRRITGSRRATGPRNTPVQSRQAPNRQAPQNRLNQRPQQPVTHQSSARPAVGQPIPPQPIQQRRAVSTPSTRLAQLTAQTAAQGQTTPPRGPVALTPEQARRSLFGRLNDDVKSPEVTPKDMPIVTAVPTKPVSQESLQSPYGEELAGGR